MEGGFIEMTGIKVLDCGIDMEEIAGPMACCATIAMVTR